MELVWGIKLVKLLVFGRFLILLYEENSFFVVSLCLRFVIIPGVPVIYTKEFLVFIFWTLILSHPNIVAAVKINLIRV